MNKNRMMSKIVSMIMTVVMCMAMLVVLLEESGVSAAGNVTICGVDIGIQAGSYMQFSTSSGAASNSGYYYNGYYLGASQCFGFARWCQYKMFGEISLGNYDDSYKSGSSKGFYHVSANGISDISAGSLTVDNLKTMISAAKPGAHLRTHANSSGVAHSLVITNVTNSGFSIAQCNGSNNNEYSGYKSNYVGTYTYTWSSYVSSTYGQRGIDYIEMPYNYPYTWTSDTESPQISAVYISEITPDSFRVVCEASDNVGISRVEIATWTTSDQSDLIWRSTLFNGVLAYFVDVPRADYREKPEIYISHVYVYDHSGNYVAQEVLYYPEYNNPVISNVYITDMSLSGYTVHCTPTDDKGITKVEFPTWTEKNSQDDIVYGQGTKSGNEYVYRVNVSDHNNETGAYITHIYAYDASGNYGTGGVGLTLQNDTTNPVLTNVAISNVSSKGYIVTCKVTDDVAISRVEFPTWTDKNGQDDIIYGIGTQKEGVFSYRVNISDHRNETGIYHTHIYAFDYANNYAVYAIDDIIPQDSYIVNFNPNGGTCDTTSKSVTYNSTYGDLPTPVWKGHVFKGWFTAETGGTQITKDSKVTITANQTLYAQWVLNSYTITLDSNDGSGETTSIKATWSKGYGTLPALTRSGYTFLGWFTAADGGTEVTASTTVATNYDHTLYAHWQKNTVLGDVNNDGILSVTDAVMMQKYLLRTGDLTTADNADLTSDGMINAFDLAVLKRKLLNE